MLNSLSRYDFKCCKVCGATSPATFRIRPGWIHVCPTCSLHYLDYLDEYSDVDATIHAGMVTGELVRYLETQLQSSADRFERHIRLVAREYGPLDGKRILDIGCGSGLFLRMARELGAEVVGVELDDGRAAYCHSRHNLDIVKNPIESEYWESFHGTFDIVTLWDVVEHVNFPLATIQAASKLLKEGGIIALDTPARDSFYHRLGVLTYRFSFGRLPTFLNALYSAHPYGHKQILSTREVQRMFEGACLDVVDIEKFHELSFPYRFYLRKLLRFDILARMAAPVASFFFACFRIKNKFFAVGRRNVDGFVTVQGENALPGPVSPQYSPYEA